MIVNNYAYKYETLYIGTCTITHCWTNGTVTSKFDAIKNRHNTQFIKPYSYHRNVYVKTIEKYV